VVGLIEVFQGPSRQNAVPGFLQYMVLMAENAGRYERNRHLFAMPADPAEAARVIRERFGEAFARELGRRLRGE
jgi:hypothetical protein